MKKKVLLLGASGNVGSGFVEEYLENYIGSYNLVLGVHRKKGKSPGGLETRKVNLSNIGSLKKAMRGVSCVINLAANPEPLAEFDDLVEPNLIGAYNVFEAARLSKVGRVIFASSVHAVRGYAEGYKVKEGDAPRPLNFYGATKVFAEALCHVFYKKYGLSCLAIRIGAYISNDQKDIVCPMRERYDYVISQRDMGQLLHRSVLAPRRVKYGILAGVSNNKEQYLDLKSTKKLVGYKPEDDAFKLCKVVEHHVKKK
jgi:nucleoside-diphosphate-sugar epimerase